MAGNVCKVIYNVFRIMFHLVGLTGFFVMALLGIIGIGIYVVICFLAFGPLYGIMMLLVILFIVYLERATRGIWR